MKFVVLIICLIVIAFGTYLVFNPMGVPTGPVLQNPTQKEDTATLPKQVEVPLDTQNDSSQLGTATLQKVDGKLMVKINLKGEPEGASQPAHIHAGACPNPGEIKYPLNPVVDGSSETTLEIIGDELVKMLPLAINVHKSQEDLKAYVACGDVKL